MELQYAEQHRRQIRAAQFGRLLGGEHELGLLAPEAHHPTWRGAAGATGALGGRGGADADPVEAVGGPASIEERKLLVAGIDDRGNPLDRQRGFGDVGR